MKRIFLLSYFLLLAGCADLTVVCPKMPPARECPVVSSSPSPTPVYGPEWKP